MGGNATLGTIDANGTYTAPATPPIGSTVMVEAVAKDSPTSVDTTTVTISGYTPSSLVGRFAFSITGSTSAGSFARAGSFNADGAKGLAGTYENADLGKVVVTAGPKGGTFDAGEWRSALARKRESDGTVKGILVEPPFAGLELVPGEKDGRKVMTLETPQKRYEFEERATR